MDFSRIKIGDVVLTTGQGYESVPIKMCNVLNGKCKALQWTHVGISLGQLQLVEAIRSGTRICDFKKEYYDKGIRFLILRHKEMSHSRREKAALYCKDREGDAYDYRALSYFVLHGLFPVALGSLLSLPAAEEFFNVKNCYFCSELVAEGFLSQGVVIADRKPWQTMPVDFLDLKLFDIVLKS